MRAGKKHVWWKTFKGQVSPTDLKLCLLFVGIFLENHDACEVEVSTSRSDSAVICGAASSLVSQDLLNGESVPILPHGPTVPVTYTHDSQKEAGADQLWPGHRAVDNDTDV